MLMSVEPFALSAPLLLAYYGTRANRDNWYFVMQPDHILFDMDGTLTPARMEISPEFGAFLLRLCKVVPCHIVTGSDLPKVVEQLGPELTDALSTVYACSGNVAYHKREEIWRSAAADWQLNSQQIKLLQEHIDKSQFWLRTGNHIEQRIASANVSVVGRNAKPDQRSMYVFWDQAKGERQGIINKLRKRRAMKGLELVLGGETGIDIFPQGFCKAQVRNRLTGRVLFIGDRCAPGGNDHSIAMACDWHYCVNNWRETYDYLLKKFPA
jgi:phosphomannomutase